MASLKVLKSRIKSIHTTRKITKAMQLIAAARLKGIRRKVDAAKVYMEEVHDLVESLVPDGIYDQLRVNNYGNGGDSNSASDNTRMDSRTESCKGTLIVLFTADRGLCGQFNGAIIKASRKEIATIGRDNIEVLCMGRKGYEALKKDGVTFATNSYISYPQIKSISFLNMKESILEIVNATRKYKRYILIYSNYVSMVKQEVVIEESLFPTCDTQMSSTARDDVHNSVDQFGDDQSRVGKYKMSFDGGKRLVLQRTIEQYSIARVFNIILTSMLSEYAARMLAMDGATRNSTKMLDTLSRQYNQNRQSQITRELIEIISGMEAIETA